MLTGQKPIIVILGDSLTCCHPSDKKRGFVKPVMENTITKENTEFKANLWKTYSWFSTAFSQQIHETFVEFFGVDLKLKLFSIGENDNVLMKGDKYFVTQIKVNKNLTVAIRLSQTTIGFFLDSVLGKTGNQFKLETLSELEAKIITAFNELLYTNFRKILIPEDKINKSEPLKSICHIVFYLDLNGYDCGKIVISVPTNIIEPEPITLGEEVFSLADFRRCQAELKIKVGSSSLKLGEVRSLQVDDILLLERSNIYKMTICKDGRELEFKISPDPSIILNTDNDEGEDMSDMTAPVGNLWDNIQVDINAEFEKVKISLGELKQISEGLVVDVGSIYDNRIDLKVENKVVARGELVIINDRYGVRIDEVVKESEPDVQAHNAAQSSGSGRGESLNEEDYEDDDFNYDDFNDDGNI